MKLTINGREVEASSGQTVLQVARDNGIAIPTLCYHRLTGATGKCRMCLVEIENMRGLHTSCTIEARDGMVVRTETAQIIAARRLVVELLLASGKHDCLACEKSGACELQAAAYALGIERPFFSVDQKDDIDDSSQFIYRENGKCIQCGRCIAACNKVVVNEVLDFGFRGHQTKVICDDDLPMEQSTCVQCGQCVQVCPTGALIDKKARGKGRSWELDRVDTTCAFCGVGCQLTLHVDRGRNRIVRVTARDGAPNDGTLCVKGRYAYEFPSNPKRLTDPMIRRNGRLEKVSWDAALDFTAARIKEIIDRHGPDVFSAFGSGRITNENNYAIQKFTRAVIGTNNVDHCART
jgi:formate dehydrogenase major subunit